MGPGGTPPSRTRLTKRFSERFSEVSCKPSSTSRNRAVTFPRGISTLSRMSRWRGRVKPQLTRFPASSSQWLSFELLPVGIQNLKLVNSGGPVIGVGPDDLFFARDFGEASLTRFS